MVSRISFCLCLLMLAISTSPGAEKTQTSGPVVVSNKSGAWSDSSTWDGGKIPTTGDRVQIRPSHEVVYDVKSDRVIRSIHIDGTLRFAHDRDTRLDVGLLRVQAGGSTDEEGFDCEAHIKEVVDRAALLVGTAEQPILKHTATIRLHAIEGMNKESCPAIVCCGGRMEFHGAPMRRTWVKLGEPAKAESKEITLLEEVVGWSVGDRLIVTATTRQHKPSKTFKESTRDSSQTEERLIQKIDGKKITLDQPLAYTHVAEGDYRADVANLSRTVVVESAAPAGERGHTMYHRGSVGSISYAEFRHLGKESVLGRYSLHYHLCGDTMRGSSVVGASIWDSHNRWLTIHGTNYLVVRDCVGYRSKGHGFFLEDGTEVYNVLDRNLAVQAYLAKPLPKQVIPFDKNDGSGFWWANCLNSFTNNVAAECDEYGYFFQAAKTNTFDPELSVRQPDGTRKKVDIRTLPFIRFEDNEAHCQRRHAFNLGGGVPFGPPNVDGIGPEGKHPFVVKNLRLWNSHWAIHPVAPNLRLENIDIYNADYGVWRPVYKDHSYKGLKFDKVNEQLQFAFVDTKPPLEETGVAKPTEIIDDFPPITVVTHTEIGSGKVVVRGTTADNGKIAKVTVNGQTARSVTPNFGQWEVVLEKVSSGKLELTALSRDEAGNEEKTPHKVTISVK